MTNSKLNEAYVWIWLPGAIEPVVAGKLEINKNKHDFFYGEQYLKNRNAIALSPTELPLIGKKRFISTNDLHYVFRDALPDAWGRRILFYEYQTDALSALQMLF